MGDGGARFRKLTHLAKNMRPLSGFGEKAAGAGATLMANAAGASRRARRRRQPHPDEEVVENIEYLRRERASRSADRARHDLVMELCDR